MADQYFRSHAPATLEDFVWWCGLTESECRTAMEAIATRLTEIDVEYVYPVKMHSWGQRVVRFYDPDRHIVEVGENMQAVVNRFINEGISVKQISERMDVSLEYVNRLISI